MKGKEDPFRVHRCTCGKTFIPTHEYVYKLSVKGRLKYYCSYTCWRKAGGGSGTRPSKFK